MADTILIILTILLVYIYLGYPVILGALAILFPRKHRLDEGYEPSLTLVISCRNEEQVISAKLENSLHLDYPRDKLDIVVVSDCSTDGTDRIVAGFADRGVRLVRQDERKGKTAGLNAALGRVSSEVVVFSDANAMYDRFALRRLVRHFADDRVGYVVGYARYESTFETCAGTSEGLYWNMEVKMKEWESAFSSVVGGDGAIYAIRGGLYEPLRETDINDFVNPLQIVARGYRGIFDREAWCSEKPAGQFQKEFARKVRIVNRSFNGLLRVPGACNPIKAGRFAWQLISHKLLRWFSPFIILAHFILTITMHLEEPAQPLPLIFTILYFLAALLAFAGCWRNNKSRALFYFPYYLALMNIASAAGILIRLRGKVITTWDTVRENSSPVNRMINFTPLVLLVIITACLLRFVQWFGLNLFFLHASSIILFLVLAYTYLGYPLAVAGLAKLRPVRTKRDERFLPEVTLLIVAYNEGAAIESKLLNCLGLDYPPHLLRIVVASDGSTDSTEAITLSFKDRGIQLRAYPENRGKIAALNDAMEGIASDIVVFSDASVLYHPQAIRKLVRHFFDPRVGAVSGKVILQNEAVSYGPAEKQYYCIEHFVQEKEGVTGTVIGADGAMYAIRRSLFTPPPFATINDDFTISMNIARNGYLVLHDREALGYEKNLAEIGKEFRRKVRIIAGGMQYLLSGVSLPRPSQRMLWFKFVSHKVLRWFSGVMTMMLLVILLVLSRSDSSSLNTWMLYSLYASMLIAAVGHVAPATRRITPIGLLHYLFVLKFATLVGCYLGLSGRQKVTWKSL